MVYVGSVLVTSLRTVFFFKKHIVPRLRINFPEFSVEHHFRCLREFRDWNSACGCVVIKFQTSAVSLQSFEIFKAAGKAFFPEYADIYDKN